jgi:hypothetical protein
MTPLLLPPLLQLDRYRNEGTRVYSPHAGYTEAGERYRPDSRHPFFRLPVLHLTAGDMRVFEANPPEALRELYLPGNKVAFCIHPQLLEEAADDPYLRKSLALGTRRDPIPVAPSSSTRTLYVLDGGDSTELATPCHALKVHFPFRISRYGRRMREEVVEQAVNVSRELEARATSVDPRFAFLREVLGVTHRDLEPDAPRGENWGFLVRDMTPFPGLPDGRSLVPGFALYGGDFFHPQRPPLLMEIMRAGMLGGADPRIFLLEAILLPIVRQWVACFLAFGLMLEPHGQNVLLEVDGEGRTQRIVHRDLSLGIDMRRRRDLGLPSDGLNAYNRMEDGTFASIAYDRMMGGHFFDHLLKPLLTAFPNLHPEDFRGPCREEFARLFPDHERYLPRTVQYFSEERDGFGKPLYLDTGQAPEWRP